MRARSQNALFQDLDKYGQIISHLLNLAWPLVSKSLQPVGTRDATAVDFMLKSKHINFPVYSPRRLSVLFRFSTDHYCGDDGCAEVRRSVTCENFLMIYWTPLGTRCENTHNIATTTTGHFLTTTPERLETNRTRRPAAHKLTASIRYWTIESYPNQPTPSHRQSVSWSQISATVAKVLG